MLNQKMSNQDMPNHAPLILMTSVVEERVSRPESDTLVNKKIPNAMPEGNTMLQHVNTSQAQPVAFARTALGLNQLWRCGLVSLFGLIVHYHKILLRVFVADNTC